MRAFLSRIPLGLQAPLAVFFVWIACMAGLFGFLTLMARTEVEENFLQKAFANPAADQERLQLLLGGLGLMAVALFCLAIAYVLITERSRLRKYLPILKGIEAVGIQDIIDITGSRRATVFRDLRSLINANMVDDLYIDYKSERVVSKTYIPGRSWKTVVKCDGCDGNNELIVGITKTCSFCGQPLLMNTPPPPRPHGR